MPGAPSSLRSAGTNGRHPQNIKRDILRKLHQADPGQDASWVNISMYCKLIQSLWVSFSYDDANTSIYEMLLSFNWMSLRFLSPTSKCLFKMSMSTFTNGGLGCFQKLR